MIRVSNFLIHCFVGSFKDKKLRMCGCSYKNKANIFNTNYYYCFDNQTDNCIRIDLRIDISSLLQNNSLYINWDRFDMMRT